MRPAPTDDLGRAVEVVNSWDTLAAEPEQIPDLEILGRFLRWIGRPDLRDLIRDGDLSRFRAVRAELRRAFDAPDAASAVAACNDVLARWPVRIRAALDHDGSAVLGYDSATGDPIGTVAASCAVAVIEGLGALGKARFGSCAGAPCTCVFVDRTRNQRRRYCSDQCNDRVAQGAHRRRLLSR
jgi:predicted RNA-binding Zn ribbon-like protein